VAEAAGDADGLLAMLLGRATEFLVPRHEVAVLRRANPRLPLGTAERTGLTPGR
jgi:hypothetical protein